MAHTPGPWGYEYGESSKLSDKPTVAHVGDYRVVRDGVGSRGYDLHEEDENDARLIAAAPDLLSALKDLIDDLEIRSKNGVVDCSHGVYCSAKQAIDKAEGRS